MKRYIRASKEVCSSVDVSDYQQMSSALHDGGDTYALYRKRDNGMTRWAAAKYENGEPKVDEAFAISYEQARGFEPISDIGKLSREVGKLVLGAEESYQLYRNNRNENKYIEVRKTTDGHTWYRSFMFWNTDRGPVKNYYTSKSNKGRWHRGTQESVKQMLEDYNIVESVEDGIKEDFSYAGSVENPNDIVSSETVKASKDVTEKLEILLKVMDEGGMGAEHIEYLAKKIDPSITELDDLSDRGVGRVYNLLRKKYKDEIAKYGDDAEFDHTAAKLMGLISDDKTTWPEELTYDEYPEGDQIIEVFIDVVGDLNLFEEPSGQGGVGSDFFYDEGGDEIARIDLQEEEEQLTDMYYDSKSKEDFKNKVRNWMIDLCGLEGRYNKR